MNRVPRCRLPPTPGTNLVAAPSALEQGKLRQSFCPSCCPTASRRRPEPPARTSASLGPASHQTPFQPGESLLLLLLPWWLPQDPGICEPGRAWVELELSPPPTPPAAPFGTLGDICRDPYRPGSIVVVLFCLRPISSPAPPPRHRPILSRRLCVTYTHTPSSPGGIHPSVGKYLPRPVFAIVYNSWLDHTCLTSPTTYISPHLAAYIPTYSQLSPEKPRQRTAHLLLSTYISLSPPRRPGFLSSPHPAYLYEESLLSP